MPEDADRIRVGLHTVRSGSPALPNGCQACRWSSALSVGCHPRRVAPLAFQLMCTCTHDIETHDREDSGAARSFHQCRSRAFGGDRFSDSSVAQWQSSILFRQATSSLFTFLRLNSRFESARQQTDSRFHKRDSAFVTDWKGSQVTLSRALIRTRRIYAVEPQCISSHYH